MHLDTCLTASIYRSHSFAWLQLIYLGPLGEESCRLVDYLQAQPGVSALPPGHNPATWMLEVTGGAMATSSRAAPLDFAAIYQVHLPCLTRRAGQASKSPHFNALAHARGWQSGQGPSKAPQSDILKSHRLGLAQQRFWLCRRVWLDALYCTSSCSLVTALLGQ